MSPDVSPSSFAAQPKSIYRFGSDKMRTEEASDPVNHIHGLIVIAEPNIWMADLDDHTGRHIVDPGPTFFARAPVFGMEGVPPTLFSLEFGCEADFLAANAPTPLRSEQIGRASFDVYRVDEAGDAVEILEEHGSRVPTYLRYYHGGKLESALRYDVYTTGLADDPHLFVPPADVRYAEAGAQQ